MKINYWIIKSGSKLPQLGTFHRGYISIGSFLFGVVISYLFANTSGILFISLLCGMLYGHKNIIHPFPNTILLLYITLFSFGLLVFTKKIPGLIIIMCVIIGVILGTKLKKKFE